MLEVADWLEVARRLEDARRLEVARRLGTRHTRTCLYAARLVRRTLWSIVPISSSRHASL